MKSIQHRQDDAVQDRVDQYDQLDNAKLVKAS